MKKKLLLGLSMVGIVAAASAGTTLAVLSHQTETATNTMTVGNVNIEQLEYQRKDKSLHITEFTADDALIPFAEETQMVLPSVSLNGKSTDYSAERATDRLYCWGNYVTGEANVGCNGLWDPAKVENAIDKIVMVKNTGTTDVYFRTLVAIELPDGMTLGEIPQGATIMTNDNGGWYTYKHIGYFRTEDGTRYSLRTYTYDKANNGVLEPGETARPSFLQLLFANDLENKDMAKFGEDGFKVLVVTQAVQASNIKTPSEALDAAFGEVTTENNPFVESE